MTKIFKVESLPALFDRTVLLHHAMGDQALANEVLGLFLQQLATLKAKPWPKMDLNFEMHTLKGSAAAMGALQLETIGRDWREIGPALQPRLNAAIAAFEAAAN